MITTVLAVVGGVALLYLAIKYGMKALYWLVMKALGGNVQ